MNTEIKAAWIKALRSGEYQQGQNYLNANGRMCCLGVLCELAVKAGVIDPPRPATDDSGRFVYDGSSISLPNRVMHWAGIPTSEGDLPLRAVRTVDNEEAYCLSGLNDTGSTFAQIADVIEEHF